MTATFESSVHILGGPRTYLLIEINCVRLGRSERHVKKCRATILLIVY
jgi:hypothetical protein